MESENQLFQVSFVLIKMLFSLYIDIDECLTKRNYYYLLSIGMTYFLLFFFLATVFGNITIVLGLYCNLLFIHINLLFLIDYSVLNIKYVCNARTMDIRDSGTNLRER